MKLQFASAKFTMVPHFDLKSMKTEGKCGIVRTSIVKRTVVVDKYNKFRILGEGISDGQPTPSPLPFPTSLRQGGKTSSPLFSQIILVTSNFASDF